MCNCESYKIFKDHKPDAPEELCRMHNVGGKVVSKAGIARVVWKRPRTTKGPVRRSTVVDEVPFLAIARSLGKNKPVVYIIHDLFCE